MGCPQVIPLMERLPKAALVREAETKVGDVIETTNGSRFLVLPSRQQLYLGNADPRRSTGHHDVVSELSNGVCRVVGHIVYTHEAGQ